MYAPRAFLPKRSKSDRVHPCSASHRHSAKITKEQPPPNAVSVTVALFNLMVNGLTVASVAGFSGWNGHVAVGFPNAITAMAHAQTTSPVTAIRTFEAFA